jgi:heme/copper-type cytochrome/quinol oxidase subunit 2
MRDIAEDSKQRSSSEEKKDGNKKLIIIIIAVAVVIIAGLATTVIILLNKKEAPGGSDPVVASTTQEPEKRDVLVTEDNVSEVVQQMEDELKEYVPMGYYTASMNYTWHFKTGDSASYDARVRNVDTNTNPVYFDLLMADDESHVIYMSPIIPLGAELNKFSLDEDLDEGTYDCILVYHLVDDDQNTISTVRYKISVIVEG